MKFRTLLAIAGALVAAVVIQTSVFGRFRLGSVAPDLVMVVVVLASLRLPGTIALVTGFAGGLIMDALSSDALGLRAAVYSAVVFLALRTRERADAGPVAAAVWIGLLSMFGILLLVVLGTLFGQVELAGAQMVRRIILVPLFNLILAFLMIPLIERMQLPQRRFR